jgi:hypothetical protein
MSGKPATAAPLACKRQQDHGRQDQQGRPRRHSGPLRAGIDFPLNGRIKAVDAKRQRAMAWTSYTTYSAAVSLSKLRIEGINNEPTTCETSQENAISPM